jgi:hypothetical protein
MPRSNFLGPFACGCMLADTPVSVGLSLSAIYIFPLSRADANLTTSSVNHPGPSRRSVRALMVRLIVVSGLRNLVIKETQPVETGENTPKIAPKHQHKCTDPKSR